MWCAIVPFSPCMKSLPFFPVLTTTLRHAVTRKKSLNPSISTDVVSTGKKGITILSIQRAVSLSLRDANCGRVHGHDDPHSCTLVIIEIVSMRLQWYRCVDTQCGAYQSNRLSAWIGCPTDPGGAQPGAMGSCNRRPKRSSLMLCMMRAIWSTKRFNKCNDKIERYCVILKDFISRGFMRARWACVPALKGRSGRKWKKVVRSEVRSSYILVFFVNFYPCGFLGNMTKDTRKMGDRSSGPTTKLGRVAWGHSGQI